MVKGVSARGGKACEMCGTWSRSTSSASLLLCFHVPTVSPSKAPAAKWWSELSGGGTLSLPGVPALASNKLAWEESVFSPLGSCAVVVGLASVVGVFGGTSSLDLLGLALDSSLVESGMFANLMISASRGIFTGGCMSSDLGSSESLELRLSLERCASTSLGWFLVQI